MAESAFHIRVLTPERAIFEGEAVALVAPGSLGSLGILAHHAPLITGLVPGKLVIRPVDGSEQVFAVSGGFLEFSYNRGTVLADAAENPQDIDVARAEAALGRARERLKDTTDRWDVDRAEAALKRALNRLRIAAEPDRPRGAGRAATGRGADEA